MKIFKKLRGFVLLLGLMPGGVGAVKLLQEKCLDGLARDILARADRGPFANWENVLTSRSATFSFPLEIQMLIIENLKKYTDALYHRRPVLEELRGHTDFVCTGSWGPGGIVTASRDGTVRVWHRTGQGWESEVLQGHTDAVFSASWRPDGNSIVTASTDGTARVWHRNRQGWSSEVVPRDSIGYVYSTGGSPDGNSMFTVGLDHIVRVWHRSLINLEDNQNMLKQALFILLVERLHRVGEPLDLSRRENVHLREIFDSLEEFAQTYLIENYGVAVRVQICEIN